jgi:protein FAM32A
MPSKESKVENIKDTQTYENLIPGPLKLKGRKLKETSSKKKKRPRISLSPSRIQLPEEYGHDTKEVIIEQGKTEVELRFEHAKQERERKEIERMAQKSYRERVEEFNKKVAKQTEHYDIPKVGPG